MKSNEIMDKSSQVQSALVMIQSFVTGRVIASAWWLGTLVMIQSYTANLAAFLTIKSSGTKIFSVADLARQTEIKYGLLESHQVQTFFDTSTRSPYK